MKEEKEKNNKSFEYESNDLISSTINEKKNLNELENIAPKPSNQLTNGLLGWYSVSSSESIKEGKLNHFTIYNEPLVLYRDREGIVRCVKDVCPHRGASFLGGEVINGQLVCPYHGARFSSQGSCTNLDRITCQHIITNKIGLSVNIKNNKDNSGQITFSYKSQDQLDHLIHIIKINY